MFKKRRIIALIMAILMSMSSVVIQNVTVFADGLEDVLPSEGMTTLQMGQSTTFEKGSMLEQMNLWNNNSDWVFTGNWIFNNTDPNAYMGDWCHSFNAGDSLTIDFTGKTFILYGRKAPGRGIFTIYIDDMATPVTEVDTNSAADLQQVEFYRNENLGSGSHKIKIVNKNGNGNQDGVTLDYFIVEKPAASFKWEISDATIATIAPNSDKSECRVTALKPGYAIVTLFNELDVALLTRLIKVTGDQTVSLEETQIYAQENQDFSIKALSAGTENRVFWKSSSTLKTPIAGINQVDGKSGTSGITTTGSWTNYNDSQDFGGGFSNSTGANSSMTLSFNGEFVRVYGFNAPGRGIYDVYLDGVYVGEADCYYKSEERHATIFELYGLAKKDHTLKLVVSGRRNPSSNNAQCSIDFFEYGDATTNLTCTTKSGVGIYNASVISFDGMSQQECKITVMANSDTSVTVSTDNEEMKQLYNNIISVCSKNLFNMQGGAMDGKRLLTEGGLWTYALWFETQPMGGYMYGKFDSQVAKNNMEAIINNQRADGLLPHLVGRSNGGVAEYLALGFNSVAEYGLDTYYLLGKDKVFLQKLYDALEKYDDFLWKNRDSNKNGILEQWCIWDSGEDEATRFNGAGLTTFPNEVAPDKAPSNGRVIDSTLIMADSYANRNILSQIAKELGMNDSVVKDWENKAKLVASATTTKLWNDDKGAFFDWDGQNNVELAALSSQPNLRGMHQNLLTQEQADIFVEEHLMNPDEFFTTMPIPSTAINDPFFMLFNSTINHTWAGSSMGLTLQRSVKALENYGKLSEMAQIGERVIKKFIELDGDFPIEFNPMTGERNPYTTQYDQYGPMALGAMEYYSHMYGVYVDRENISWNGMPLSKGTYFDYSQKWFDKDYKVSNKGGKITASLNGTVVFEAPNGVRVLTDYDGSIKKVIGMSSQKMTVDISFGGNDYQFDINPDEVYLYVNGAFVPEKEAEPETDYLQLEKITPESAKVGWDSIKYNTGLENLPLQLKTGDTTFQTYAEGICGHADSEIVYNIEDLGATRLTFYYGINNQTTANAGRTRFNVTIDGAEVLNDSSIYDTSTIQGAADIEIPAGAKILKLSATHTGSNINNCHAVWAEPRLYVSDKNKPLLKITGDESVIVGNKVKTAVSCKTVGGKIVSLKDTVLSYSSENDSIATVDANGVISGIAAGSVNIICSGVINGYTISAKTNIDVIGYAKDWIITSPNTESVARLLQTESGSLFYYIEQSGERIVEISPIGMKTNLGDFSTGLAFKETTNAIIDETYSMMSGKASTYVNKANETTVSFTKGNMTFDVIFRAYDDGAAYRYNIKRTDGTPVSISISDETSTFVTPVGSKLTYMPNAGSYNCHEGKYNQNAIENVSGLQTMPLMYETAEGSWALISEADLDGEYCGSFLNVTGATMKIAFPTQQTTNPSSMTPFASPWRFAVTGSLKNIIENTMAENLSPAPSTDIDWSFVKPGVTSWTWMVGYGSMQKDPDAIKQYIDLAQEMGWQYFLLDDGWQPNPSSSKEVYSWFPEIVKYAEDRGIGILVWVDCENMTTKAKRADRLEYWKELGIKGIKIDFFNRESQERIQFLNDVYKECAELGLVVNCHGTNKPTGEVRTYPNVLQREGLRGEEYNANLRDQNTMLPFVRGSVGASDYTPRIIPVSGSNITTGQQMALNILLEGGLPTMSDSADNYLSSIGKSFLKNLPAAWDETLFIDGKPGEFVAIARRSGEKWYAAAANNEGARSVDFKLDFLDEDMIYRAEIYKDGVSKDKMILETKTVVKGDTITVTMQTGGGCSIKFVKPINFISIKLPEKAIVEQNKTYKLVPETNPADYNSSDLIWNSSDETIAKVSPDGTVSGIKAGTVTITAASALEPNIKSECVVTVTIKLGYYVENSWTVLRRNDNLVLNAPTSVTIPSEIGDFGPTDGVKNMFIRDAADKDFDISVKVTGVPTMIFHSFGIFARVGDDGKDMAAVIRRYHDSLISGRPNVFDLFAYNDTPGQYNEKAVADTNTDAQTCYLRLVKNGAQFTGYYKYEGASTWTQISSTYVTQSAIGNAANASDIKIGVFSTNSRYNSSINDLIDVKFEEFTYNGTVIPFCDYQDNYVLSIDSFEDVTVGLGTEFNDISLPTTVNALLADGSEHNYSVIWSSDGYDGKTAGTYKINGTITTNGIKCDIVASINVIVKSVESDELVSVDVKDTLIDQNSVIVNMDISNNQQVNQPCNIILAIYDKKGVMVKVASKYTVLDSNSKSPVTSTIANVSIGEGYTIKLFVWDDKYIPLINFVNILN